MRYLTFFIFFSLFIFRASAGFADSATAVVKGTTEGSTLEGTVTFEEGVEGLKIIGHFKNVPPGKHGFHIHEGGSCADAGNAAGGHFNPDNVDHGFLKKDGFTHAHAGDLGNLEIGEDGTGEIDTSLLKLTLTPGKYDVAGKALIIHEKADDFGQPTGNAGGRIGCGIIEKAST